MDESITQTVTRPLLDAVDIVKHYPITKGAVRKRVVGAVKAVDGVSLTVERGETLGLVGESGSGKSSLARLLVRLEEIQSGHVLFGDVDIASLNAKEMHKYRRRIQMVFQDPYSSLNPRITVGQSIMRAWQIHKDVVPQSEWRNRCVELLSLVGLGADRIDAYPHQLSGGQRQRVAVARAVALEPDLIVCDEAVSALDVSVQAQVLEMLAELQTRLGVSYVFISHDLGVVRDIAHRVAVMYLGRIVEVGTVESVYERPAHPYTQALLAAMPQISLGTRKTANRPLLMGEPPSPANIPSGCRFRTRCPIAQPICAEVDPMLAPVEAAGGHNAACHFPSVDGIASARQPIEIAAHPHTAGRPSRPRKATP
ncbi:ABC transporter ATP-binding protein [Homoserinimonas sp. A447]